jgi:hypothetical protein
MEQTTGIAIILQYLIPIVTLAVSITVLITFKRNSQNANIERGKQEQAQCDNMKRLDDKIDILRSEVIEKVDVVDQKITEVKDDVRKLSARVDEYSTAVTVIKTQHEIYHPPGK